MTAICFWGAFIALPKGLAKYLCNQSLKTPDGYPKPSTHLLLAAADLNTTLENEDECLLLNTKLSPLFGLWLAEARTVENR